MYTIKSIIAVMPARQKEFLEKQTSNPSSGKKGNLQVFCSSDGWQEAAIRATDTYFKETGGDPPARKEEKIGYGLIILAGQDPCYKKGWKRFCVWENNIPKEGVNTAPFFAAIKAAGRITLSIVNLPSMASSYIDMVESNLSPTGSAIANSGSDCYQPTREDAARELGSDGLFPDELRVELERDANRRGLVLCPDWWEKLQADIASRQR